MTQNMLTLKQITKETGLRYYTVDYLIKTGQIEATSHGKGIERLFPPDTIGKIRAILERRGLASPITKAE